MRVEDWGTVAYQEATERQLQILVEVQEGKRENTLIVCSHPPVVTVGRGTKPGDIFGWDGEVQETQRGGRVTYHGPNQIIVYPIINLNKNRDLHQYMRALEGAIVECLKEFGIQSEAKTIKQEEGPSLTGVWVGERKIASIGIAVKKWVTYHGLALNVSHDPDAFTGIRPCGFQTSIMTNMESVLGQSVQKSKVSDCLVSILEDKLRD